MALNPAEIAKATALYWNVVESAARLGSTTYELWQGLRDVAAAAGQPGVGVSIGAISHLRGQAGAIVRAAAEFEAARPGDAITANMVGTWPTARPLDVRNLSPQTLVRGTRTFIEGGVQQSSFFTFRYGSLAGMTVSEITSLVSGDAAVLTEAHDQTHEGIGAFQIIAM